MREGRLTPRSRRMSLPAQESKQKGSFSHHHPGGLNFVKLQENKRKKF